MIGLNPFCRTGNGNFLFLYFYFEIYRWHSCSSCTVKLWPIVRYELTCYLICNFSFIYRNSLPWTRAGVFLAHLERAIMAFLLIAVPVYSSLTTEYETSIHLNVPIFSPYVFPAFTVRVSLLLLIISISPGSVKRYVRNRIVALVPKRSTN